MDMVTWVITKKNHVPAFPALMERRREDTKQHSQYRDYQQIYIYGPFTPPQRTAEIQTAFPIGQTLKDRKFADTAVT